MNNYFEKLQARVDKYRNKYREKPGKAALRLMFWNLKCIFRKHKIQKANIDKLPNVTITDNSPVRIGFNMRGGLGDFVISINYLKMFIDYNGLDSSFFTVYVSNTAMFKSLLPKELINLHLIQSNGDDITVENYDLFILIMRFPEVRFYCAERIKKYPLLFDLVKQYNIFKGHNYDIVAKNDLRLIDSIANMFCLIHGKNRLQQSDINELLGIQKNFSITPNISLNEKTVLTKFNLEGKKFITFNRNTDINHDKNSTKLWPNEYYNELIRLIKRNYSDYTLVQLGVSEERSEKFSDIDVSLIGQTNLEELKIILKNAVLHVDGEGGLVHLRRSLTDKKSLVLYGPTDINIYGYDNNINLKMPVCPVPCEWFTRDWSTVCMKTNSNITPCMQQLTPDFVFSQLQKNEVLKTFNNLHEKLQLT